MQQHNSSVIRGVGYDWDTGTLTLNLRGRRYEYYDVPEETYQHLIRGESLGKAFHKHVKNKFGFKELER